MLKRPRLRSLMMAFSFVGLILLLSACGAPTPGVPSSGTTAARGGIWIDDLFGEPDSLIPNASSLEYSVMVDQTLYTPLFYGDANATLHPGLVTELPTVANGGVSPDFKTWTFHLRPNVKWSDGMPVNADDVDFSWRLWTHPKFTASSTIGFNLIASTTISPDNLTITFHLKQSFGPFVSIWADGLNAPLPAHHFRGIAPDSLLTLPDNLNPSVTDGPFLMKESKSGDHYTVVRNPTYYRTSERLPYLDGIVFRIVLNQNTILKDLQAGIIDSAWFLDVTKTSTYQRLTNYKLQGNTKASVFEAFYFNFRNIILGKHREVRQAMAMAMDQQALINVARHGQAVPLCTDHPSGIVPGFDPSAPCPKFDPAAANALLDQNGWVKGPDGVRTKDGMRLEFEYSTTANNPWRTEGELILQQDFKAIGIKIDIQNYLSSTLFGSFLPTGNPSPPTGAVTGRDDIFEHGQGFNYDADDSILFACTQFPPNGQNFNFYCNPALDKLFAQEQQTGDPAARQQIFHQIHQISLTDFPFVTEYATVEISMHKLIVHNYNPGPEGATETINNWEWWCDGGHC